MALPNAVSVKDVARVAGVSLGTVSNVLNHPDRVRTPTRERVERAIAELGFVRNESARQLRAGHSQVLAYLVPSTDNAFFTDVARGARRSSRELGLALFLCSSDSSGSQEADHLRLLVQQRVRGLLLTPLRDLPRPELEVLRQQRVGVVLVDRAAEPQDFCAVSVDDVTGGRLAADHLLSQGHTSIAFVGDPESHEQVADRLAGAQAALAQAAAAGTNASLTVLAPAEMSIAAGLAVAPRIDGHTAAFCANDLLALGVLQYAVSQGMRVPQDLALVGYDDLEFAAGAAVPLTSVRQPRDELGQQAVELLRAEVADLDAGRAHHHQQRVFTPELVVRRSSQS